MADATVLVVHLEVVQLHHKPISIQQAFVSGPPWSLRTPSSCWYKRLLASTSLAQMSGCGRPPEPYSVASIADSTGRRKSVPVLGGEQKRGERRECVHQLIELARLEAFIGLRRKVVGQRLGPF